ncbi:MAG TPA: OsmC family protein [Bacilli bacterium]|nr:MAG: OsmC-like protein [Tenericutes bacterium ADurb.BinA124]HOH18492.1 OsmC family protein [Bacilli bacterium]HPX84143.1 OsmC family protein [Bacilli bacterium]HQC74921.1 OsmC family protein [Bacilli bacterium]
MAADNIKLDFTNTFNGTMIAPKGQILIGTQEGGMRPYNLLFGALGACFYATFLSIVEKKRLSFASASVEVSGRHRDDQIGTLEYVQIKITIRKPSDEKQFLRSVELGAKYCSIHETISKVAQMEEVVVFED